MNADDFVKRLQGYVTYNSDKNPPSKLQWDLICKDLAAVNVPPALLPKDLLIKRESTPRGYPAINPAY